MREICLFYEDGCKICTHLHENEIPFQPWIEVTNFKTPVKYESSYVLPETASSATRNELLEKFKYVRDLFISKDNIKGVYHLADTLSRIFCGKNYEDEIFWRMYSPHEEDMFYEVYVDCETSGVWWSDSEEDFCMSESFYDDYGDVTPYYYIKRSDVFEAFSALQNHLQDIGTEPEILEALTQHIADKFGQ